MVVLAADVLVTAVLPVLLLSVAASLAEFVPEAVPGSTGYPGLPVRTDSCCEIVTKGQYVLGVPPLVIGQTGDNDGGTQIRGLPQF